jgi:DNA repair protein RecO (recombination protein O)
MPLYTAEALILRTYKFGEADRIVVFLTRDRGKKRGVARGARRARSRFSGALEPLTRTEVAYFEREHRELVGLNYAEPLQSPLSATDGAALGYVGYFAELIDEWAPEADPNERLFRLGAAALDALVTGTPVDRLVRYFEYWLLRLQGVYPSLVTCQRCRRPLASEGAWLRQPGQVLLCGGCVERVRPPDLSPGALAFLRRVAGVAPGHLGGVDPGPGVLYELERVHRALIMAHLEREPRSSRVLRSMTPGA